MRIMGIDPGIAIVGYGILEEREGHPGWWMWITEVFRHRPVCRPPHG